MKYRYHLEESIQVKASPEDVFNFANDHKQLSSHMNQSSWMMGGGSMKTIFDAQKGKKVGSHIKMQGKVFGIELYLDEVVSEYNSPYKKEWHTVGSPKLLVIGQYRMGIEIQAAGLGSELKVFIDYNLPETGISKLFSLLFGNMYAKWCVKQMINSVHDHYER